MSSIKFDPVRAALFGVVFLGVCTLVALGKVSPELLKYLLFLLAPSPLQPSGDGSQAQSVQPPSGSS